MTRSGGSARSAIGLTGVGALLAAVIALGLAMPAGAADDTVRVAANEPLHLDPAAAGDSGSAFVIAQLFESLTAFDGGLTLRPALARDWQISDGGRTVTFRLRDGLRFSDGSPLTADDVVDSWLRVLDPRAPSPLASLLDDVTGAAAYRRGQGGRTAVGLRADGDSVVVTLDRPGADLPAIVASQTFAVVPASVRRSGEDAIAPGRFVGSGGYVLESRDDERIRLRANDHYWAGRPAIATAELVTADGDPVAVPDFESGAVDYAHIGQSDGAWIRYDRDLGPRLRAVPDLSVTYYGFDTRRPPFDDVRVRRAFGAAIDWRRIAGDGETGSHPATSMVPPGIKGRSGRDFRPPYDPELARRLLAEAGYPGGRGFPAVRLVTSGYGGEEAILADVRANLGIEIAYERMPWSDYGARLDEDPPAMWALGWHADYPARNDFLGVLLRTSSSSNNGRWSLPEFDAAIDEALSTADPLAQAAAFDRAEELIGRDVPVVPVSYGESWALSRGGLLGAADNGLSGIRLAGLAWDR